MNVRRIVAASCIAVALAGVFAIRLDARGKPFIVRDYIDSTFTTGYCGFPMQVHTTGSAVLHFFLDEASNPVRLLITAPDVKISFTNLDTGATVWTPSVNIVDYDIRNDGTVLKTLNGLFWRLVLPGEGLITADVGRLQLLQTFDSNGNVIDQQVTFSAGQQEGVFPQELCAALAPAP
jgi:hypothetical protein